MPGDAETVPDTTGTRAPRWSPFRPASATLTAPPVVTPEDVRRHKEIEATRIFIVIIGALAIAVAIAFPFLRSDPEAEIALAIAYLIGLAGTARTARRLRDPQRYTDNDALVFAATCVAGGSSAIFYFGYFSPAALVTVLGIFFFSLSCSARVATFAYVAGALPYAACMVLIALGVINDHGLLQLVSPGPARLLIVALLIQLALFLTFYIGRGTARALTSAIDELHVKTRELAQRDALLQEARRELDQALKIGGPGRFTEQRLGSFELGVLVGRGAMSDVYEAVHLESGEPAAVKLLHRDIISNPTHVRRFLREVRIAADLALPNVVRVLEVGGEDAPVPYLAMELLHGVDLAQLLRDRRLLEGPEVIEMLRDIGRGVDAAHAAKIVHRDLKPQNLFRHAPDGGPVEWKVLDFGISRLLDGTSTLTDGHAVGTPSYMSPEQARGREVDHRADIFSLGVIAYRSLTGRPAFIGREIPHILHEVVFGMPPQPSELAAMPVAVDAVLAVAMAKRAGDRFHSAGALVAALEAALHGVTDREIEARAARLLYKLPWGQRWSGAPDAVG